MCVDVHKCELKEKIVPLKNIRNLSYNIREIFKQKQQLDIKLKHFFRDK